MTLVEILMVIVLFALIGSGTGVALGAVARARLRTACSRLISLSGSSYHQAIAKGMTVRILLDLGSHKFSVQQARQGMTLLRADKDANGADRSASANDGDKPPDTVVDPWEMARRRLKKSSFDKLEPVLSPWEGLQGKDGEVLTRFQRKPLGDGVRIVKVWVPHEPVPKTSGQAALYFFPGGVTEHAVVQLADKSDNIYSVEINALTGRGKVYNYAFEPEDLNDEAPKALKDSAW